MGMAASQARYLALTGRMNDIEYQGQQINQQRTTLSTQINELYNSLLDMTVPTPPSQTDFSKTVYSGTLGATKFTMGTVRPTGSDNYSVDLNYTMSGDSVKKSTKAKTLVPNTPSLSYVSALEEARNKVFVTKEETTITQGDKIDKISFNANEDGTITAEPAADTDIMIATTVAKAKEAGVSLTQGSVTNSARVVLDETEIAGLENSATIYIICNVADLNRTTNDAGEIEYTDPLGKLVPNLDSITNVSYKDAETTKTIITGPEIGYGEDFDNANAKVAAMGFYTYADPKDGETYSTPELINTVDGLKKAIENGRVVKRGGGSDAIQLKNMNQGAEGCKYLVKNGNDYVELFNCATAQGKEAIAKCDVNLTNIVSGLRHSFNLSEAEYPTDNDVLALFSVYVTNSESGTATPHFIKDSSMSNIVDENFSNIPSYDYDAAGTYTNAKQTDNCKLEFDATGRITKIGIPNENGDYDWVELTVSTETDQAAYEEAMKDYNYEKIMYDKRQEEINLKTSIVQQQDKNLELKLTRLDNERNALNTELEAVKKVVTDNIQKTYKTFSG